MNILPFLYALHILGLQFLILLTVDYATRPLSVHKLLIDLLTICVMTAAYLLIESKAAYALCIALALQF
jgi:hypothetical protein